MARQAANKLVVVLRFFFLKKTACLWRPCRYLATVVCSDDGDSTRFMICLCPLEGTTVIMLVIKWNTVLRASGVRATSVRIRTYLSFSFRWFWFVRLYVHQK